jgi:ATP-dependent Clp protease adaptor protein ClpS
MNEVIDRKKVRQKIKPPNNYFVIFKNDDYTPMEFVVYLLRKIFNKTESEAERIMMNVHSNGEGIAGLYPLQISEQKAYEAIKESKENQYPLNVILRESN